MYRAPASWTLASDDEGGIRMESTAVQSRALPELDANFSGEILRPADRGYADGRRLWNASIDRRPCLIARARNASDVATAVLHARDAGMEIAVRGGGHSTAGHSMSHGGVTIDLSLLRSVEVDPRTRTARVGGGALLIDVAKAGAAHSLAMPYGHVSHTGIGGLTLGGGMGWIMRRFGLTIDSLRSAQVVTASGGIVTASEEENPDLFWALRGGGGNFGVVTEFEFDLHPHGPEVLAGLVLYRLEDAGEALRQSRAFMDEAPDEISAFETFLTVPPGSPFPTELRGKPAFGIGMVYAGPVAEGEVALRPLRELGQPVLDLVAPMPNVAVQSMLDPTAPPGMRNYNKSHWLRELPDEAIDRMVELHADVTSPMSLIINARMGGAVGRVPPGTTAFGDRDAYRLVWVISAWWEGDDAEHIEWCRRTFDALTPHSTGGAYVNALANEGAERIRASYDDDVWRRLVEAKDRWDPENVFRLNQNIPPS
jgi:FAD/FMN-containing dehydrogenase